MVAAPNRQGYLRGAQLLAAEQMQRAANQAGKAPNHAATPAAPASSEGGLTWLDWVTTTVTGAGGATGAGQLKWEGKATGLGEKGAELATKAGGLTGRAGELVKVENGVEWWRSANNGALVPGDPATQRHYRPAPQTSSSQ